MAREACGVGCLKRRQRHGGTQSTSATLPLRRRSSHQARSTPAGDLTADRRSPAKGAHDLTLDTGPLVIRRVTAAPWRRRGNGLTID